MANSHSTQNSTAGQLSVALAETGLNNAIAVLNGPNTNVLQQSALPSSYAAAAADPNYHANYAGGTAYWWGVLTGSTWSLHARGASAAQPQAPPRTHELTASVTVTASLVQRLNTHQWDYVMSTATGNTCDQTIADGNNIGNPDTITSRLYVFGNLCIGTNQGGVGHVNAGPLMVKGKLTINEGSSSVGSSGSPIPELHVAQGCKYLSNTLHNPCQQGTGGSGKDNVWSSLIDSLAPTITAPVADWDGWYTNANPGPNHACGTTSGTGLPTWDSNGVRDNSVAAVWNMTPATSYSCVSTDGGGHTIGQLTWDATNKLFTVAGTMFVDGSAKIANGVLNQYNGQGTLYLSGTFYMGSGSKLCGVSSGSNCDFATWNPNTELWGIVTNSSGGQDPATVGTWLYNAQFEGALYATNKIRLEGTTQTGGPMVASEVELGYNVSTASASSNGFPLLNTVPVGLPGVPNVHAQPQPPSAYAGY